VNVVLFQELKIWPSPLWTDTKIFSFEVTYFRELYLANQLESDHDPLSKVVPLM
jgi:hypothetical protein